MEIVSPSSRKMDYIRKTNLYLDSGVREYWIVDPAKGYTIKYYFKDDDAPVILPFNEILTAQIYQNQLSVCIADLLK